MPTPNANEHAYKLYNSLKNNNYDVGDYSSFKARIANDADRRQLYDVMSESYANMPTYEQFSSNLGYGAGGATSSSSSSAAEQRAAEQRAQEQRAAEQRAAEQRAAEQRAAEQRAAEQRAAEQRAQEQRAAEQRAAEQRAAEQRAQEQRAAAVEQSLKGTAIYVPVEEQEKGAHYGVSPAPGPKRSHSEKLGQEAAAGGQQNAQAGRVSEQPKEELAELPTAETQEVEGGVPTAKEAPEAGMTEQQRLDMSMRLFGMQRDWQQQMAEDQRRIDNLEKRNTLSGVGRQTVVPWNTSDSGLVTTIENGREVYILPDGETTENRTLAKSEEYEYQKRNRLIQASSIDNQLRRLQETAKAGEEERARATKAENAPQSGLEQYLDRTRGVLPSGLSVGDVQTRAMLTDADFRRYNIVDRGTGKLQDLIKEAQRKGHTNFFAGAWRGFVQSVGDRNTWTFGLDDSDEAWLTYDVIRKWDNGEKLTASEQALFDYVALSTAVMGEYGKDLGRGYTAGQVTGESLPFMVEMLVNPAAGFGEAAAKRFASYAVKRFGRQIVSSARRRAGTMLLKGGTIASRGIGDALGAAMMNATTGMPQVVANTAERMAGSDFEPTLDQNGKFTLQGHKEGLSSVEAFEKAFTSNWLERYSEMLGGYFEPGTRFISGSIMKGLEKSGLKTAMGMIERFRAGKFYKGFKNITERTKWNGVVEEYAEEVVNNIGDALLVGDQTFDTNEDTGVFNLDRNIDTFLGVSLMSMFFTSVNMAGMGWGAYNGPRRRAGKLVRTLEQTGYTVWGADRQGAWLQYINAVQSGDEVAMKEAITNVVTNAGLTTEQKRVALQYAAATMQSRGADMAEEKLYDEGAVSETEQLMNGAYDTGYDLGTNGSGRDWQDVKSLRDAAIEQLNEQGVTTELLEQIQENPYGALTNLRARVERGEVSQGLYNAVSNFIQMSFEYAGLQNAHDDNTNAKVMESDAQVDAITRRDENGGLSGEVVRVTLEDGSEAYVMSGNVARNDDGSVNIGRSSSLIIIKDAEDGSQSAVSARDIVSVDEAQEAGRLKVQRAQQIQDEAAKEWNDAVNGVLSFAPGDVYHGMNEKGEFENITVIGPVVDEKGMTDDSQVIVQIGDGQPMAVERDEVEGMVSRANKARIGLNTTEDNQTGPTGTVPINQTVNDRANSESPTTQEAATAGPSSLIPTAEEAARGEVARGAESTPVEAASETPAPAAPAAPVEEKSAEEVPADTSKKATPTAEKKTATESATAAAESAEEKKVGDGGAGGKLSIEDGDDGRFGVYYTAPSGRKVLVRSFADTPENRAAAAAQVNDPQSSERAAAWFAKKEADEATARAFVEANVGKTFVIPGHNMSWTARLVRGADGAITADITKGNGMKMTVPFADLMEEYAGDIAAGRWRALSAAEQARWEQAQAEDDKRAAALLAGDETEGAAPADERDDMVSAVNAIAYELGLGEVRIVEARDELPESQRRRKGMYNTRTGKITVVLPNNHSRSDVERTVLHEAVVHHGLRELFGNNFSRFLDGVYRALSESARAKINRKGLQNHFDFHTATEEYLGDLCDGMDWAKNPSLWSRIRHLFHEMLRRAGFAHLIRLSDNDLRYILWKSRENLEGRGRGVLGAARDIAKQRELKVGDFEEEELLYRSGDDDNEAMRRAQVRDAFEAKVKTGMYQTREAMLDHMASLKEAMELITKGKYKHVEDIPDALNPYLGENRLSSVNEAEVDAFQAVVLAPLYRQVRKMARTKEQREELVDYIMSKHGLERNEYMAQRDAEKEFEEYTKAHPTGKRTLDDFVKAKRRRDYAGLCGLWETMSLGDAKESAEACVQQYEAEYGSAVDALWEQINKVNDAILSKSLETGLMSQETYDYVKSMYKYYIPLRGFDEKTSRDEYAYLPDRRDTFQKGVMKAHGRRSKADDPFANLEVMAASTIVEGNRNALVKQRFYNFVMQYPSDLVSVAPIWLHFNKNSQQWEMQFPPNINDDDSPKEVERKLKEWEEQMAKNAEEDPSSYKHGREARRVPYKVITSEELRQHQVIVRVGGDDYILTVNGNPRLAQAVNGKTNPDNQMTGSMGAILNAVGGVNRGISAIYTTLQPDFIVSNYMRDMIYSNVMTLVKESPSYAAQFTANCARFNPLVMFALLEMYRREMKRGQALSRDSKMLIRFREFMKNGGETGYVRLMDIEEIKKKLEKKFSKTFSNDVVKVIGDMGRAVEMSTRFAAFVTSRSRGRDIARSIWDAKEVTVNFNKKGAGDKFLGKKGQTKAGNVSSFVSGAGRALYIFWNASVQGTFNNFFKYGARHPIKFAMPVAGLFIWGLMKALSAAGGGGDDDEGKEGEEYEPNYFDVPSYTRRSNIVVKGPNNTWLKYPLAIEMRTPYGLGELFGSCIARKEELTPNAVMEILMGLSPVDVLEGQKEGEFSWTVPLVPSTFKTWYEAQRNVSFSGVPIYKDTPYNKDMPAWTKAYGHTNKDLINLSAFLNDLTGGDNKINEKGKIDMNPAYVEYMLRGYVPFYTLENQLSNLVHDWYGDKEFDWRDVPLANRVVSTSDETMHYRQVNNKYFKLKEEHDEVATKLKKYNKQIDENDDVLKYAEKIDFLQSSKEYKRYKVFEVYRKDIDRYDKKRKEAVEPEEEKFWADSVNILKEQLVNEAEEVSK